MRCTFPKVQKEKKPKQSIAPPLPVPCISDGADINTANDSNNNTLNDAISGLSLNSVAPSTPVGTLKQHALSPSKGGSSSSSSSVLDSVSGNGSIGDDSI